MKLSDQAVNRIFSVLAILLLLLGMGLRLLDLSDPPLDFHPSRQLFSYTIARGIYYRIAETDNPDLKQRANEAYEATDRYEPRILEGIVALFYVLAGGENIMLARVIISLLWMLGGWFIFKLGSSIASPAGGLFSLGYYLLLPFSIQASRSFQPDVLMVVGLVLAAYAFRMWQIEQSWRRSIFAGLLGGLTVLIKAQGAYAIGLLSLLAVLSTLGLRRAIRSRQVWLMAALTIVIPGFYYFGPFQTPGASYFQYFTVEMSRLLRDPAFYVRWLVFIDGFMDLAVIALAFIGVLLLSRKARALTLGLWGGYLLLGLFFPWQIHTHDYYSLSLIPTVALGLAPIGGRLSRAVWEHGWPWRGLFLGVCLFAIAFPSWLGRSALYAKDYRNEPGAWRKMGEELPRDGRIIALTHDYGWRLQYWGYTPVTLWPYLADYALHLAHGGNLSDDLRPEFEQMTSNYDYFLVTDFGELRAQPQLEAILEEDYSIIQEGDGYVLYDLRSTKPEPGHE
jgi:hypothetical protein